MSEIKSLSHCDDLVRRFESVIEKPKKTKSSVYYTGVDLGTACVVLCVLDEHREPVAGAYEYADVVRDGMVVDYIGAAQIVRRLKEELEEKLGVELIYAAGAIPPGTDAIDHGAIRNVVESAGFTMTNLLDEPTAANLVLGIENGAVVDIGGGTTGISVIHQGTVTKVVDEPTGGTHFSLVLAGAYKVSFEEAELKKRNPKYHKEILPLLTPVVDKVASIISHHVDGEMVKEIVLVGGTACLSGMEAIVEKRTGIKTIKPENPMFVTPLGIALSCGTEAFYGR